MHPDTRRELSSWLHSLRYARRWRDRFWHIGRILSIAWHALKERIRHQPSGQARVLTLGVLALGAIGFLFIANASHANSKHTEAPRLRAELRQRYDNDVEFWFSPRQGTVLALMKLGDNEYGGLVHRVTENNGKRWLGRFCYECTAFIGSRNYWYGGPGRRGVIKRDGYVPLWSVPDIARQYMQWLRIQLTQ